MCQRQERLMALISPPPAQFVPGCLWNGQSNHIAPNHSVLLAPGQTLCGRRSALLSSACEWLYLKDAWNYKQTVRRLSSFEKHKNKNVRERRLTLLKHSSGRLWGRLELTLTGASGLHIVWKSSKRTWLSDFS